MKNRFSVKKLAAALLAATLGVFLTAGGAAFAEPSAENFSLRSLDGATVTSASLRGKVVVLAFGASWLPRAQAQNVQKLADKYAARGVEVFWVSVDADSAKSKNYASDEQLRQFAAHNNLRVGVLRDPDAATLKRFGVDQIPAVVVLDRQGNAVGAPLAGYDPSSDLATQLGVQIDKSL